MVPDGESEPCKSGGRGTRAGRTETWQGFEGGKNFMNILSDKVATQFSWCRLLTLYVLQCS